MESVVWGGVPFCVAWLYLLFPSRTHARAHAHARASLPIYFFSSSVGKASTARAATPPRSQKVQAAARSRRASVAAKRKWTAGPAAQTALDTEAGRSSGSTPRAAAAMAAAAGFGKATEAVLRERGGLRG